MLQDCEKYVYHYTRAKTLAEKILPHHRLRFSRFRDVNDPREAKDWVLAFHSLSSNLDFDWQTKQTEVNKLLKHTWCIGCFTSDVYEALGTREREDRGEDIIAAMYERGHSHPRMWAQYGDSYKGACLVLDKARLDTAVKSAAGFGGSSVRACRVEYRNPPPLHSIGQPDPLMMSMDAVEHLGLDRAVEAHIAQHWKELFFVKARDWEQECEFRWLVKMDSGDEFFVDIGNSLVGIALGDRFPDRFKPAIGKYAITNDVSITIMDWKNGFPQPMPTPPILLAHARINLKVVLRSLLRPISWLLSTIRQL